MSASGKNANVVVNSAELPNHEPFPPSAVIFCDQMWKVISYAQCGAARIVLCLGGKNEEHHQVLFNLQMEKASLLSNEYEALPRKPDVIIVNNAEQVELSYEEEANNADREPIVIDKTPTISAELTLERYLQRQSEELYAHFESSPLFKNLLEYAKKESGLLIFSGSELNVEFDPGTPIFRDISGYNPEMRFMLAIHDPMHFFIVEYIPKEIPDINAESYELVRKEYEELVLSAEAVAYWTSYIELPRSAGLAGFERITKRPGLSRIFEISGITEKSQEIEIMKRIFVNAEIPPELAPAFANNELKGIREELVRHANEDRIETRRQFRQFTLYPEYHNLKIDCGHNVCLDPREYRNRLESAPRDIISYIPRKDETLAIISTVANYSVRIPILQTALRLSVHKRDHLGIKLDPSLLKDRELYLVESREDKLKSLQRRAKELNELMQRVRNGMETSLDQTEIARLREEFNGIGREKSLPQPSPFQIGGYKYPLLHGDSIVQFRFPHDPRVALMWCFALEVRSFADKFVVSPEAELEHKMKLLSICNKMESTVRAYFSVRGFTENEAHSFVTWAESIRTFRNLAKQQYALFLPLTKEHCEILIRRGTLSAPDPEDVKLLDAFGLRDMIGEPPRIYFNEKQLWSNR